MKGVSLICMLVLVTGLTEATKLRFDGYKVFRITPENDHHVSLLHKLKELGAQFWEGPSTIGKSSDVMLPPHLQGEILQGVLKSGVPTIEFVSDVQALMDAEIVNNKKEARLSFTEYHRLDAIYQFLDEEAAKHSEIASVVTIGKSFEGRDIKVLKISKSGETKPAIWLDTNIHAREWISSAVATYMIDQLLNNQTNAELQSWTEDFDFYILPVANPDGFEYSHTDNRMWRKTRSDTDSILGCKGADPNRNFGFEWLTGGSSDRPCDDTFAGAKEFSEVESLALAEYFTTIADRAVAFISVHSYGQYILLPYGTDKAELPEAEHQEYLRISNKVADAISTKYGTKFVAGSITELLYPASGGSIDWVKGVHNTKLVLAFELRDQGDYAFILPAEQIIPSAEEFMDGFQVFIDELRAGATAQAPKPVLKSPVSNPIFFDRQTFGDVPSKVRGPIIPVSVSVSNKIYLMCLSNFNFPYHITNYK